MIKLSSKIALRNLMDTEEEYIRLHTWCSQERIYRYFEQRVLSYEEIVNKYKSRITDEKIKTYIIEYEDKAIGLVQYSAMNKKEYNLANYNSVVAIDIFIGEQSYSGKGVGTFVINKLSTLLLKEYEAVCLVPHKDNIAAIKSYEKAGFKIVLQMKDYDTLNKEVEVVVMIKDKILLEDLQCKDENIDIYEYMAFTSSVKSKMDDPNWLGDFDEPALNKILNNDGKIWIYYDGDIPVCSMMFIPATEDNLERFGLPHLDYKVTADYGPMMVSEKYRGHHLQYQMLEVITNYAKEKGYKYAICTVHPDNLPSKNNVEKFGFSATSEKEFRRGKRIIYVKDIND